MNPPGTQAVRPLTVLSEEETLFRTVVRDYAETTIARWCRVWTRKRSTILP